MLIVGSTLQAAFFSLTRLKIGLDVHSNPPEDTEVERVCRQDCCAAWLSSGSCAEYQPHPPSYTSFTLHHQEEVLGLPIRKS
ncbi:hypothetical protein E2C01_000613 [Portunus trituberculatus]|uniref:Uncharacterized protein n=1 Tax=Portunus trituberculatus TaxID=210409 RepID=A0A5B7CEK1_PORTR|nr:hypothetical protein [Portunus trituberculatus]